MSINHHHSLSEVFASALATINERVAGFESVSNSPQHVDQDSGQDIDQPTKSPSFAIAYSGGLDSAVLLHLAHQYAIAQGRVLYAFHIHHGLSPHADQWQEHCRQQCAALGVTFAARQVAVVGKDSGVEEAARIARYAALGALCTEHGINVLLTAHHLDDQAETVLLQLLRGSGVAGMSGMDIANRAPGMLGSKTLAVARPLLAVTRVELEQFAHAQHITYVEDESNSDPRYARNALRHQVMPALATVFPGFQQRFARTAQHAQSAQRLLIDLAAQDLLACQSGESLDVNHLQRLGADRADNLLRYWFGLRGLRMPSTAWLSEMRAQLFEAKADAQLCVTHPDCHIRRHRDRVFITPRLPLDALEIDPIPFMWNGAVSQHFPQYRGSLFFDADDSGIDAEWLRRHECTIHYRQGGERLKPAANRPTKSLKYHYQAADIPAWEREQLPIVSSGGKLLFAAGLGMDNGCVGQGGVSRVRLRWQFDRS